MKKIVSFLNILLMAVEFVCGVVCAVQFAMAIRYGELGRVVFYATLAVFAMEFFFFSLIRLVRMRKEKREDCSILTNVR